MTNSADEVAGFGRVLVVCPHALHARARGTARGYDNQRRESEARHLVAALELEVCATVSLRARAARSATLLSLGQCEALAGRVRDEPVELVFVDATLSPRQQRNLEDHFATKVLDRTGLILEVFAMRARSRAGRLQVSLAHLAWQRTRLVRSWTHLERQRGGLSKAAGPGERQLELDRRLLDRQLLHARGELARLSRRVATRRARRHNSESVRLVALVGYSNAGKSTLFNALTRGGSVTSSRLFETLDPRIRRISLEGMGEVVLSDTVGFLSDLPHELIEAFRTTLEEVRLADLILHVHDAASPYRREESLAVASVLEEILGSREAPPILSVWNKVDLLGDGLYGEVGGVSGASGGSVDSVDSVVSISARRGDGLERLRTTIRDLLRDKGEAREILLPHDAGAALAWLHRHGEVWSQKGEAEGVRLQVYLGNTSAARFAHLWPGFAHRLH